MSASLDRLIGRQLVVGIPGTTLAPAVAEHLRRIHAGGVIAFERNYQSPDQFRALLEQLAQALDRPPLVAVDHEGGRIVRFSRGVTRFPDALTVGATNQPEAVRRQGATEAKELKALGVHINLAPCLDVLVEGADPVIGPRSYGSDPKRVAAMGVARIQGMQQAGLAACAKHFPGLGAVPKDPHKHLPTVGLEWPTLCTTHLLPFIAAIEAGVASVMSSHVCYPTVEASGIPATFSARLIRGLLRGELGFDGLLFTDDLEMGALRALCSIGEAAVRALAAGHDAVLICSSLSAQHEVFEALRKAYREGRLSVAELERSVERIETIRRDVGARPLTL